MASALVSSITGNALPAECVIFGEIALSGGVRPVSQMEARLKEAEKLGFSSAIVPAAAARPGVSNGLKLTGIADLASLLAHLATGEAQERDARDA